MPTGSCVRVTSRSGSFVAAVLAGAALLSGPFADYSFALSEAEPKPVVAGLAGVGDRLWGFVPQHDPAVLAAPSFVRPFAGQPLVVDSGKIAELLRLAPNEGLPAQPELGQQPMVLLLPDPFGKFQAFSIVKTPLMEPGLAAQFPDWVTVVGQGIDDPTATIRADYTSHGFRAQVLSASGSWYIDPVSMGDTTHLTSYSRMDFKPLHRWACEGAIADPANASRVDRDPALPQFISSGTQLRTYRLAVACTGEYAAFFGGTVALAQAAIVTAVNRVTGVYEREVAIRMTLVASNTNVVYINASTDPYTNANGGALLGQNQTRLDTAPPTGIGSANYDIGHVFSTGGGGVAGLGVVCINGSKARGVTGQPSPVGDPFYIDFVAHEMGHQFAGDHTFNNNSLGSCAGNRSSSFAYEPGSGSTIMAYAGICSTDDIQPNSDAYFHGISFDQIRNYVTSGSGASCGTSNATGNNPPTVSGPGNFTIPANTPFFLTATGSDPDGDALTYCWEEFALGAANTLATADNGASPLTRSRAPIASSTRLVPALATVLAGTTDTREKLPNIARSTWNWRVTARDNRAAGGGVNNATIALTVFNTGAIFRITSQPSAVSWNTGTTQAITWNVAGTSAAPINTSQIAVELSTDGGLSFPTVIATVPNTGSANITVPAIATTNGRIRLRPVGNIYYSINTGVITINNVTTPLLAGTGVNTIADTTGNGNSNGRVDPGETAIALTVRVGNTGTIAATGVNATLVSNTATATVTTAAASYPNIPATSGTADNLTPYVLSISSSHPCGSPISLTLNITSTLQNATYNFSIPTGQPGTSVTTTTTYAGAVIPIPDANIGGASASVNVSGLSGTITNVAVNITGTACTSTTAGIDHQRDSDLVLTLIGPGGIQVQLANSRGGTGQNFCSTIFDDAAAASIIAGTAPFTGSFRPEQALSSFNGISPNGTWTLQAQDFAVGNTGNLRAFSIFITRLTPPSCDAPISSAVCPTITTQPADVIRSCGTVPVSFTLAASGTPTLIYQWRQGATNLTNGGRFSGVDTNTLTISSPLNVDAGSYSCVVSNTCSGSPATSNAAVLTLCRADFNCSNVITVQDLFDFLAAWFNTDPRSDVNNLNGVSVQDIFDFLGQWFAGCP